MNLPNNKQKISITSKIINLLKLIKTSILQAEFVKELPFWNRSNPVIKRIHTNRNSNNNGNNNRKKCRKLDIPALVLCNSIFNTTEAFTASITITLRRRELS